MSLMIQTVHGEQIAPFIDDVARLRIEVFHEFPYLYDGDMSYERRYLKTFSQAKDSLLVLALHEGEVVALVDPERFAAGEAAPAGSTGGKPAAEAAPKPAAPGP